MSKITNILRAIKATSEAIQILEAEGVDLNKIAGLSNTQGPQASKINKAIDIIADSLLSERGASENSESTVHVDPPPFQKALPEKSGKKPKKGKKSKP
jgi:hypothetical protein